MQTRQALMLVAAFMLAGCATEKAAVEGRCPDNTTAVGFIVPTGFGVSISPSGLKAAANAIHEFFAQRPATTSQADKQKAADIAAEAAARESGQQMSDEEKRALRSQTSQWVETYAEKCGTRP